MRKYIPIDEKFDKEKILNLITENEILPEDLLAGLEKRVRVDAVSEFEQMLDDNLTEHDWQKWFTKNQ